MGLFFNLPHLKLGFTNSSGLPAFGLGWLSATLVWGNSALTSRLYSLNNSIPLKGTALYVTTSCDENINLTWQWSNQCHALHRAYSKGYFPVLIWIWPMYIYRAVDHRNLYIVYCLKNWYIDDLKFVYCIKSVYWYIGNPEIGILFQNMKWKLLLKKIRRSAASIL